MNLNRSELEFFIIKIKKLLKIGFDNLEWRAAICHLKKNSSEDLSLAKVNSVLFLNAKIRKLVKSLQRSKL